jgi:hypothetical protein
MMIFSSERSDLLPTAIPDGFLDPDEAAIGWLCVTKQFKADFMRLLEEPIANLHSIAATDQALRTHPTAIRWKEPTPAQHIDRFLNLKHWSKVMLIKRLSNIDDYVCDTTKQFLKRLYRKPLTNLQFRIDSRTVEKLDALRTVMVANAPEQFGDLRVDDLRWTVIDSSK